MPFCFRNSRISATFPQEKNGPPRESTCGGPRRGKSRERRVVSWSSLGGLANSRRCVAFGDERGAAAATGPRHHSGVLGGGVYDALDEALVGFHVSVLSLLFVVGPLPLLETEYDGAIGPVFGI